MIKSKKSNNSKPKILELTNFSAGICGVWSRVRQEASLLVKDGYDVKVFSSNAVKGSREIACSDETLDNIKIKRFPFKKLGGESFMKWNFEKAAMYFKPDIIIVHNYRHLHTTKALQVAKKLKLEGFKTKVFLVTHAPFVPENTTRDILSKFIVKFYDKFIGPRTLNKFDKIITISNWEVPYLLKAGAKKEKIAYIPNGISEEFFKEKKLFKEENKILFLGRISPIKNLEILIESINHLKDKNIILELVGPAEKQYLSKLKKLTKDLGLERKIKFSPPIYDTKKKIKKLDSTKIFVLPSKKEGMPQSMIEAMARGKIVIGSDIPAIKDIINGKNGYLFKQGDENSLANIINRVSVNNQVNIQKNAKKTAEKFKWDLLIKQLESLFNFS